MLKTRFYIYLVFYCCVIVETFAQPCAETSGLINLIRQHHFQPVSIDQEFQQNLISDFFQALDKNGLYFSQAEIDQVKTEFQDKNILFGCHFIDKVSADYQESIHMVKTELQQLSSKALAYHKDDYFNPGRDSMNQQRKTRIENFLKLQVLVAYFFEYDTAQLQDFDQMVGSIQVEVVQDIICRLNNRLDNDLHDYVKNLFLETVARQFDPHTNYFNLDDKLLFENSLSKESLSFGFEMDYNFANDLVITQLTVGGPAWKSKQINENDVIRKLVTSDGRELLPGCIEIEELWRGITASASLELHLIAADGETKVVNLKQDKLPTEENVISSFVLQGESKVGYIRLPSFYTQFEDDYPQLGCANDVAKEIIHLKKENINGLILDLRDNGGGSMKEAIELVGIFINEGIFFLVKEKDKPTRAIKDVNKGLAFDGPLIILINGRSASASELVAASLQSYNRALIVGSRTYGKATGQNMFAIPRSQALVKITTSKFFRTDGSTYQKFGVIPDIQLPDLYEKIVPREMDEQKAISEDRSFKNVTFEALPPLPLSHLKAESKSRIEENKFFQRVDQLNNSLTNLVDREEPIPLQLDIFREEVIIFMKLMDLLQNKPIENQVFTATNHANAQRLILFNQEAKTINEQLKKLVEADPYLQEAYFNIQSLISINP